MIWPLMMHHICRFAGVCTFLAVTGMVPLSLPWAQTVAAEPEESTIKARVVGEAVPPPPASHIDASAQTGPQPLIPKLSARDLQALVASVALYPDQVLDNILDAAQHPAALHQAANLHRTSDQSGAAAVIRDDLPPSVQSLLAKNPQVLLDLDKDLLMVARLGSAVKVQPEDVVAAIREVRVQSAALAAQQADVAANQAPASNLPIGGTTYAANGGVYAGTAYPCYNYYTYGMAGSCYDCYYGAGYYPYYGYGAFGYGYGYGYGGGLYLAAGILNLTSAIIFASNGYPWYGYPWYGYPWYGYPWYGYPWYGAPPYHGGYSPYTNPYYYSNLANQFAGPWGTAWQAGTVGYGPYGGKWYNGSTTGTINGLFGSTTFATIGQAFGFNNGITAFGAARGAATINGPFGGSWNLAGGGLAGKTTIGNTTYFGAAGAGSWNSSYGTAGTASGWLTGNATVVGNTTSWHTQAAGHLQTNTGINALGNRTSSGSLVAYQDGSYGFNRQISSTIDGARGDITINRTQTAHLTGQGNGSFSGTTTVTGPNGQQRTFNTGFPNSTGSNLTAADLQSAFSAPSQRLSGQTGQDARFGSQLLGTGSPRGSQLASLSGAGSTGDRGILQQFSLTGTNSATEARPMDSSAGFGERFGGYGALGANATATSNSGSLNLPSRSGIGSVGSGALRNNSGNAAGDLRGNALQSRTSGNSGLGSNLGNLPITPRSGNSLGNVTFGNGGASTVRPNSNLSAPSIRGQSPSFNLPGGGGIRSLGSSGSSFSGGSAIRSAPRAAAPSFGGGGRIGGGSIGGGLGGGRIGGFGGGRR